MKTKGTNRQTVITYIYQFINNPNILYLTNLANKISHTTRSIIPYLLPQNRFYFIIIIINYAIKINILFG